MSPHGDVSGNVPDDDGFQLELFDREQLVSEGACLGIDRTIARAGVSPGWWPLVATLFNSECDGVVLRQCREVDGQLRMQAEVVDGPGEGEWLEPMLGHLRMAAARTCACCGRGGAARWRVRLGAPAIVACEACRARIRAGEAPLAIADEYWHLDGSRRLRRGHGPVADGVAARTSLAAASRSCTALPPEELRRVIADIHARLASEIVAQERAVAHLALLAGLHVGGGLPRGARALIIGPSGVGKSTAIQTLRSALEAGGWDLPFVITDAIDLTSPGWSGAPSIGDLIEAALGRETPDSDRARHAVVVIDEIHHVNLAAGLDGNMAAARQERLSSLLSVVGYGTVHLGGGTNEWSSQHALVIGMGAFTGLLDTGRRSSRGDLPPSTQELVRAGLPLELASRFEQVIRLRPLAEHSLRELLKRWPALTGLVAVCERLGYVVRIHDEAYARAARVVALGHDGSTPRTAGGWLVTALRDALIAALANPNVRELVVTPDSLAIAPDALVPRRTDDPDEPSGGWDARIILTPT